MTTKVYLVVLNVDLGYHVDQAFFSKPAAEAHCKFMLDTQGRRHLYGGRPDYEIVEIDVL